MTDLHKGSMKIDSILGFCIERWFNHKYVLPFQKL